MNMELLNDKMLIDEKKLSEILGISRNGLRNMRLKKEGVPWVKIGSRVRYKVTDILKFIEENTVIIENKLN